MSPWRKNSATLGALLGLALAAASGGIATLDNNSRSTAASRSAVATTSRQQPPPEPSVRCGIERWDVKTGTDPAAASVDQTAAQQTTIADLDAKAAPANPPNRVSPEEYTVYEVTGTLTAYKREPDSDYHLALDDGVGHTMIVEIPSPNCISSGPFKAPVSEARRIFDTQLRATTSFKSSRVSVVVTGVGFFDKNHGQRGVAHNGIELHPVLNISFGGRP